MSDRAEILEVERKLGDSDSEEFELSTASINIWRFVDGKPGHEKQTEGLIDGLRRVCDNGLVVEEVAPHLRFGRKTLRKLNEKSPPHLLVGAGHGVHLPILRCKVAFGGKTVLLMKPSLPKSWFNLLFVPSHDKVQNFGNVVQTNGPLCPVSTANKTEGCGLILLGGPSKHFEWDLNATINAVQTIVASNPQIHWKICDSRRTPDSALAAINHSSNQSLHSWNSVSDTFLQDEMAKVKWAWVTCDSVSMIYECLANHVQTGVIPQPPRQRFRVSKIVSGIEQLQQEEQVQALDLIRPVLCPKQPSLQDLESDRCARIVRDRLITNCP